MSSSYLDRFAGSVVASIGKQPCDAASTGNMTLLGYQTIDGVALNAENMRCLVKNQIDQTQNGIWIVHNSAWERSQDFSGPSGTVEGQLIQVTGGAQAGLWELTTPNPVLIDGNTPSNIIFTSFIEGAGSSGGDIGFAAFVVPPLVAPATPVNSLTVALPAGQAILNNQQVAVPVINQSVPDNSIIDFYLNPIGSATPFTMETAPLNNYTIIVRHPTLLKVWSLQTQSGKITSINMAARIKPVVLEINDFGRVVGQLQDTYLITGSPTNWSSALTVTFGQVLVNTLGYMYQVQTLLGGTTGLSQPTGAPSGTITDGTVQLSYYGQSSYENNFRYAPNNGIQSYFSNIMARLVVDMSGTTGTQISSIIKNYIISQFKHVVTPHATSTAYTFGQKIIAGGYVWISQTVAGGTTASSSPFSGIYIPGSSTVTDGTVTWLCIYTSYSASVKWYWMRTLDVTMLTYEPADAHDSDASTFLDVIWEYIKTTWDWQWLLGASPCTGYTYLQCLQNIFDQNLTTLSNNLTPTFQSSQNPNDGTSFTQQYTEDNCESRTGLVASQNIFTLLGDSTRAGTAATNLALVENGLFNMIDGVKNVIKWNFDDDLSWFQNPTLAWYPWYQAQVFPELHQCAAADDVFKQGVRAYLMKFWNNWPSDPGATAGLPNILFAYVAAKYWQDTYKAREMIDQVEKIFLSNGLIASDFGFYVKTKQLLLDNNRIKNINGVKVSFEDPAGNVFTLNNKRIFTASGTCNCFLGDYWVGIDKGTGAATTVNLPNRTGLPDGYPMIIKDVKGDANSHNITITPDGGNIDGSGTLVINTAYGVADIRYDALNNQWYTS